MKIQINTIRNEKDNIELKLKTKEQTIEKLQTTLTHLYIQFDRKV